MGSQNTFDMPSQGGSLTLPWDGLSKNLSLHTKLQVKPTMRSLDLTDDGLDERRQTSCVVNVVFAQGIHEPTRELVQDQQLPCGVHKYRGT